MPFRPCGPRRRWPDESRILPPPPPPLRRPVCIINPNLKDRPSSGGVMQVRGRGDRISFADSFKDIYNFRLLYESSVAFFPIKAWKTGSRSGGAQY